METVSDAFRKSAELEDGCCISVGEQLVANVVAEDKEIEVLRLSELADIKNTFSDLADRYGNKVSKHELLDRVFLLSDCFESFVVKHPDCVMDKELYRSAVLLSYAFGHFYQQVGRIQIMEGEGE